MSKTWPLPQWWRQTLNSPSSHQHQLPVILLQDRMPALMTRGSTEVITTWRLTHRPTYIWHLAASDQNLTGNILGISYEQCGNILGISWEYPMNSVGISWEYPGNSVGIGNSPGTFREQGTWKHRTTTCMYKLLVLTAVSDVYLTRRS